jgi:hypothetical protein
MEPSRLKTLLFISNMKITIKILTLAFIVLYSVNIINTLYYMYYYKETIAFIANIDRKINNFMLFLPIDRYALTFVSDKQFLDEEKTISGTVCINSNILNNFNIDINDKKITNTSTEPIIVNSPFNLPYPDTHNVPGYYHVGKIGSFNIENNNYCKLEIIFDSVPKSIFLKIETYMAK